MRKRFKILDFYRFTIALLFGCALAFAENQPPTIVMDAQPKTEQITLAGGCFWCIEAALKQFDGVISVTSGYTGGQLKNPTYEQICKGTTGHAEAVKVVFDPTRTTLTKVLAFFWQLHDPTTLNRQGADLGTQYRSAIFYTNEAQKSIIEQSKSEAQAQFKDPIVTEIQVLQEFWPAEAYHQDYYFQNKSKNPYCRLVITPKLEKLKLKK